MCSRTNLSIIESTKSPYSRKPLLKSRLGVILIVSLLGNSIRAQSSVPDKWWLQPHRLIQTNLREIAERTSDPENGVKAEYYVGIKELLGPTSPKRPVAELLKDRTKTIIVPDAPDPLWEETWMRWMMYVLCGLLCGEWLIRRLFKMA